MTDSRHSEKGFTLIEVLIVVTVISILASIALVSLFTALDKAKQRATMADMRTISKSIEAYMVDNHLPPSSDGTVTLLVPILRPYYSSAIPTEDHWRNDLRYVGGPTGYTIESYGKDGLDGADIDTASRFEFIRDIVLVDGAFVSSPE